MRNVRWVGLLVSLSWFAASCSPTARQLGTLPQASDTIYVGEMRPAGRPAVASFHVSVTPPTRALITGRRPAPVSHVPEDKIEPALRARVAVATAAQSETLIVTFADTLRIPRFPLGSGRDHGLDAARNNAAQAIANAIAETRSTDAGALGDSMQRAFGVRPIDHGWLARSVEIVLPLTDVPRLAARHDVTSIEPLGLTGAPPNLSSCAAGLPGSVSWNLGISAYLDANYTGGRIALLDTGVMADHDLLVNCNRIDMLAYCTAKGDRCIANPELATDYDVSGNGHGTSDAALLVSDGAGDPCMAGLTRARLDCFRVYRRHQGAPDDVQATNPAIERGLRTAMERADAVILPELDIVGTSSSHVAQLADHAFTAGFVIVCPVGNDSAGHLGSPGLSACVASAGGFDVSKGTTFEEESYITDPHELQKPDFQTPTNITTARLGGDHMHNGHHSDAWEFGGTSGAAPVATAMAAILREHLMSSGLPVDPGQVYAALLACAQPILPSLVPGEPFAEHGSGRPQLPVAGRIWWGAVDVQGAHEVPITIDPASGASDLTTGTPPGGTGGAIRHLDAAIWWAEPAAFDANGYPTDTHNDVNLELVDPNGGKTDSWSFPAVWEKVHADIPSGMTGPWTLHVIGDDTKSASVHVYVTVIGTP